MTTADRSSRMPGARFARTARVPVLLLVALAWAACSGDGTGSAAPAPAGLALLEQARAAGLEPLPERPPYPLDNPYSAERIALGHLLFFDPIMSGPKDVACSSCHLPRFAFGDGRQFPAGAGATGLGPERTDPEPAPLRLMPRNSLAMFNLGLHGNGSGVPTTRGLMFWGGGAVGLEAQVLNPVAADNELRGLAFAKADAIDSVVARLRENAEYLRLFAAAFPERTTGERDPPDASSLVTTLTLKRALAAYLRELVTPLAPLDDFLRGDTSALTASQRSGLELFVGRAGCVGCHMGPELSDFRMHVLGTWQVGLGRDTTPGDDLGHGEHGGTPYAFRTAPLRQVALTAPYFHAGTAETLEDVVRFKNRGESGYERVTPAMLDPLMRPLGLSDAEVADLVAFLEALTDSASLEGPLFLAPATVPSGLPIPK